ncbi:O-antigen ligase family protein, partial [bacterium]|nr:O-antigen ligase family protein [bacterium]
MKSSVIAIQHPRWKSRNVFWALAVFIGILLLIPPQFQGKAASFFILGSWLLAAAAWIIFSRDSGQFEGLSCGPPLIALMATFGLALVWSKDPAVSINPCAQELGLLLLFVTTMGVARNARGIQAAMSGLVMVGLLLALYAVYQHIHGLTETYQHLFNHKPPQGFMEREMASRLASRRAFSLFTYPNLLSGFLVMILPVSLSLVHIAKKRWSIWIRGMGLAVLVMGLYATGSVGGWLTAAMGSVVYMILVKKYFKKKISSRLVGYIFLAGGFLTLAGLFTMVIIRTPQGLFSDMGARIVNWGSTLRMIWSHPITGVGPGIFGSLFPEFQAEGGYYIRFAHNILLHRWAETGLAGLAALFWLGAVIIKQIKTNLSLSLSKSQRFLALGLISGLSAGFLHACLDVDLNFLKTSVIFWFFLGTLLGLIMPKGRAGFKNAWHRENSVIIRQTRPLVQVGLCIIACLVLWKGGKSLIVEGALFFGTGALAVFFLLGQARDGTSWTQWVKKIPLRWPLGLLFIWCIFSALVSLHPAAAIPGLTLAIAGLLCYVITVLTPRAGILLVNLLAPAAVLTAGVALFQLLVQPGIRITAWWPNPNLLAAFLSMGFLSNLGLLLLGTQSSINRMVSILGSLVIFIALLATGSLGGILNCLAGFIILTVWLGHRQPQRLRPAGIVLILMLAGLFLLPLAAGRRIGHMDQYHAQAYERTQIARSAIKMIWSRPFAGFGPGNFKQAFERFSFPNIRGLSRYGKLASFAHNEILQLGAIAGIPGLLFLLWMIWSIRFYFIRQWRAAGPEGWQGPEGREERAK